MNVHADESHGAPPRRAHVWMVMAAALIAMGPWAPRPAFAQEVRVLQETSDRLMVVLPNRMIVVAQELRAAPVVSAQIWVKTGSIYEQEHLGAGLSHFLEHLLAGGSTANRTEAQTNEMLGQIGAQVNAATGLDTVHYYINTTAPFAGEAVELLSDWLRNNLIDQREFDRERQVIQREFDMGRGDPSRILWKLTQQARYRFHPARDPTIGYFSEFLTVTRDEIAEFYRRMYVPNNMVFVVAGDIDRRRIVDQIASLWRDAPAGNLPDLSFPVEPVVEQPRTITGQAAMAGPRLRLAWPGTRLAGSGDYALDLLAVILGQGESSRLVRTVRDQQQVVSNVSTYNLSFPWGEGFFGVDAQVPTPGLGEDVAADPLAIESGMQEAVSRAREAVLNQIGRLIAHGVTTDELARAKRQTLARVTFGSQTASALASRLARDLIGMHDPDYLQRYAKAIQAVTADEVLAAARRFLDPSRLITITLLPQPPGSEPQPLTRPEAVVVPADLGREQVDLANRELIARFEARQREAGEAAPRPPVVSEPIEQFRLPNGLRLLVGRSTVAPAASIQLYQIGGLLGDEPGREGVANAVASMLTRGTTTRSAQQIARELEDLGASLSSECGNNSRYVQAVCLKEDWPAVMALVADVTLRPTFPQQEWAVMKPRLLDAIRRRTDSWFSELRVNFRETYFAGHPWSQMPVGRAEVVASLTAADLAARHRDRLGADQMVLAVVGDVEPRQVYEQAVKLFGDAPREAPKPFVAPDSTAPASSVRQHLTEKPLAAVQIGFGPGVERANSIDYAALSVLARVMSNFPAGWLEGQLRGQGEGLAYATHVYQFTGLAPGHYSLVFNTDPAQAPKALALAMAVADRARREPVPEADLARAKAAVLTHEFMSKQTNTQRGMDAALGALYGLAPNETERFLEEVQNLDADFLQLTAQAYLRIPVVTVITNQAIPDDALQSAVE